MVEALDLGTLNKRLKREKAKSGAITASLIWNDPSDLDLHAEVQLKQEKQKVHIFYAQKKGAGGYLDVDMNAPDRGKRFSLEPVENIFWESPPAGKYSISVINYRIRSDPRQWGGKYTNDRRAVPFKVFLNKDGKMKTVSGQVKHNAKKVCFTFTIAGGSGGGSGGGGNYIVFPPETAQTTFKALCAKHRIPWKQGSGYYAVARSEKIHSYKEMLLQNIKTDKFTVGSAKCRKALGWAAEGELRKGPKDITQGCRLFVQSTSANRVIPAGTHVLFEVSAEEYAKHRKARSTKYEGETHTAGKKGLAASAKAKARAKAKAKAKPKAKAKAKPKAGAKRAAAPPARGGGGGGGALAGKKLVFTGTLEVPRSTATRAAQAAGATVVGAVSASMDVLVAGPGAGSKLAAANALGKAVWDEAKFKRAAGL